MTLLARIDAEADRLVRGLPPAGDDPELAELAGFVAELRAAQQHSPAEEVRDRHLKAIDDAVRTRDGSAVAAGRKHARASTWITPARRGRAMAFRLAAIGLAAAIGVGGLAAAGVSPTGPVESALERIGIKSDSGDDEESPEATEGATSREDAREDAARNRPTGNQARRRARDGDGKAGASGRGDERRSETGTVSSGPGRATAEEAAGGGTPPSSPGRSGAHRRDGSGSQPSPGKGGGNGSAGGGTGQGKGSSQGKGAETGSSQSQGNADSGLDRAGEAHQSAGANKP